MPAGLALLHSQGRWRLARHLSLLNEHLLGVAAGDIKRLMVFMPPRFGKSELVSKYFPAWYAGRFPDDRLMLASYEADFAASWGRKARDVLEEVGDRLFNITVSDQSSAANRWDLKGRAGGMSTAGVGGPLTGKGANVLIIDDPVKNAEDAQSKVIREKQWDWYQSTAYTRLEPDGRIILTMTRWHEDDLAGRLLRQGRDERGEKWTVLSLSAIAERGDILGREEGEVLWPERFSRERLDEIKVTVGSYWWASLYQQRPSPQEGGIFQRSWFRYYKSLPENFDRVIQIWDLAFKDLKTSAYVCGQVWGKVGANKYLIDQIRQKLNFPATVRAVRVLTEKYPQASAKYIEDAANGPAVMSVLKDEIPGIIPISATGSKESRASAASPQVEAGNIYLPDGYTWVDDFVEEAVTFPNSEYKDQVDCMAYAILRLTDKSSLVVLPGGIEGQSRWRG